MRLKRAVQIIAMAGVVLSIAVFVISGFSSVVSGIALALLFVCLAVGFAVTPAVSTLSFGCWMLGVICAAMYFPQIFVSWGDFELKRTIVPLIQIIMLGMGMTLTISDFLRVFKIPQSIIVGFVLQFTVMPSVAFVLAIAFKLESDVAAGLILFGACAGGVASNVMTYLAGGNVALSVSMTALSTLASPLLTPLAMSLLAGRYVPIEVWPMMVSIVKMIIIPIIFGLILNRYASRWTKPIKRFLPIISMIAICGVVGITIGLSRDDLLAIGLTLIGAAVIHNATGYFLGYMGARLCRLEPRDCRTVALEVGMQNGGMATGLAFNVLGSAQAAMASAVEGPWGVVSSSLLTIFWHRHPAEDDGEAESAQQADGPVLLSPDLACSKENA